MVVPLRLPQHWSEFLSRQPETGMDYQIVDLTLRDGRVIRDVAIAESTFIGEARGQPDLRFDPADITHIEVTHNKWDFQRERQS